MHRQLLKHYLSLVNEGRQDLFRRLETQFKQAVSRNGCSRIHRQELFGKHLVSRRDRRCKSTEETQSTPGRPGLGTYIPLEGEWLALIMRTGLRREATRDRPYSLDVVLADPQTLQTVVRHASTLLNKAIKTARDAIRSTAGSYVWDKWVKIRETVEMYPAKK